MNEWAPSLISSLVTVIVTLGGVIGYLKTSSKNSGNGCSKLDKEFNAQVQRCNERFLEIAEDGGEVKATLKGMSEQLGRIEGRLKRR